MKRLMGLVLVTLLVCSCMDDFPLRQLVEEKVQKANAWIATRNYAFNSYTNETGVVYRSLFDNNLGHQPSVSPLWWFATGEHL